jgi:hypothetical protein
LQFTGFDSRFLDSPAYGRIAIRIFRMSFQLSSSRRLAFDLVADRDKDGEGFHMQVKQLHRVLHYNPVGIPLKAYLSKRQTPFFE